jgi:hypothetical protein
MKPSLFSFIGDEFANVFRYSDLFLPGIQKIVGIYYSAMERKINLLSRIRDDGTETNFDSVLQKRENVVVIQKFRTATHPFSWMMKAELPFELSDPHKLIAPNLFTELENVILVLRFKNEADELNDLLLIYFNQNLGNFGLNKSDKILTTDNKAIIGTLLYYQFKSILQMNQANRELLLTLNNVVRSVIHENGSLKDQLNQIRSSYSENVLNMARQNLKDLSVEYERNFILTEESIEKLRGFKGNLKHLPAILRNAVVFTENLLIPDERGIVSIEYYSLDFDSYQIQDKTEQLTRKIDSRQSRAMQLLDKLERASKILQTKNLPLIGSKVGKAMEPPVTAPAITDALGKNREIIRQILDKYPEKWEIIRKEFKPLLNQLRKRDSDEVEVESA